MSDPGARIGITCPPDHPVFSVVGESLADRGHEVIFFDPTREVPTADLESLSLLVHKRTRPASVRALLRAERQGVPTWNSATGVSACVSRFTQLCLLRGVGFPVPAASPSKPDGSYVAKPRYHWEMNPELNGEGDVYEELLDVEPIDYKYYVVDDGTTHRVTVLRTTSKLYGDKRVLGEATPVPAAAERVRRLADRLGMRSIGVDLVRLADDAAESADGERSSDAGTDREGGACPGTPVGDDARSPVDGWYAVDLNPCPSFVGTGMEEVLVDSILDALE